MRGLVVEPRAVPELGRVQVAAERGAGRAAPGALGVDINAAGDFVTRMLALQAQNRAAQPPAPEPADEGVSDG